MLNDVKFNNEISAFKDWNIVLTNVDISPPTPKTMTVDIKGMDGSLDLTEALTDDVKYSNRSVKLTFEVMDDIRFYKTTTEIANYLHGKQVTFVLSNDEDYFYKGRASINQWSCSKRKGKIVIEVDCDPYKYDTHIKIYNVEVNNETKTIALINGRKLICPIIKVTGNVTLKYKNVTYDLVEGNNEVLNFILKEGSNVATFSGTGTAIIEYRRGEL